MSTLTIFTSVPEQQDQAAVTTVPQGRPIPAVLGADLEVPVKGGKLVGYANLDYAASAPCLEPVSAAVAAALPAYSSVHRGAGYASQLTTARYEQARHTVRAFAGARPDDAVIFTRNTTDATNLLARCLPDGTTVGTIQDGDSQSIELIGPESTAKDLFSRFEIEDPAAGEYNLLVRSFDDALDEIPFTIQ